MKGFSNNQSHSSGWNNPDTQMDVEMDLSRDSGPFLGARPATDQDSAMEWESASAAKQQGLFSGDAATPQNRQMETSLAIERQQGAFADAVDRLMANQRPLDFRQTQAALYHGQPSHRSIVDQMASQSQLNHFGQSAGGQMPGALNQFRPPPYRPMAAPLMSFSNRISFEEPNRPPMAQRLFMPPNGASFSIPTPSLGDDEKEGSRFQQWLGSQEKREREGNQGVALNEGAARRPRAQGLATSVNKTSLHPAPDDEWYSQQSQRRRDSDQESKQERNGRLGQNEGAGRRPMAQRLAAKPNMVSFNRSRYLPTDDDSEDDDEDDEWQPKESNHATGYISEHPHRRFPPLPLLSHRNPDLFSDPFPLEFNEAGGSQPYRLDRSRYNSNPVAAIDGLRDREMAVGSQTNLSTFTFPGVAVSPTVEPAATSRLDMPPMSAGKPHMVDQRQLSILDTGAQKKRARDQESESLDGQATSGSAEAPAKEVTPLFLSSQWKRQRVSPDRNCLEPEDGESGFDVEGDHLRTQELPEDYISTFWGLSDLTQADASASIPSVTCTTSPYLGLDYEDSIRILRLDPGAGPNLSCRMETARLTSMDLHSSKASYEAISYVWGNAKDQIEIETPDGIFHITRNLSAALHRLRYPDKPRYIWADAICINQNDDEEKGHQVRLMRQIYQHASKVLVWLGPDPSRKSILAYSVLCGIASGGVLNGQPVGQANFYSNGVSSAHIPDLACRHGPPDVSYKALWGAVQDLFSVSWFWRVWCIQEVALANTATVIWGNSEISWRWLGLAAARLRTNYYAVLQQYNMDGVFNAYLNYRISLGKLDLDPLKFSFSSLLALTRQYEATDPRDRIFGLLGIPTTDSDPDHGEFFMEPDYSLSAHEVYRNLAFKVLRLANTPSLLSSVQHGDDIDKSWPTWIPQWEKVYTTTLAPSERAEGHRGASLDIPGEFSITQPSTLDVRGLELYTVVNTLPKRDTSSTGPLIDEDHATFLSDQGIHRSVAWTLTAGKSWYGLQVTEAVAHLDDFASYMRQEIPTLSYLFTMYPDVDGGAKRFKQAADSACNGRRLFSTHLAQFGLGPSAMRAGDRICVLFGSDVPFVLRPEDGWYSLVGECYMYGLMEGQAIEGWRTGRLRDSTFSIR